MWDVVVQQPLAMNGMPLESQQAQLQQQQQAALAAAGGAAAPAGSGVGEPGSLVSGKPLVGGGGAQGEGGGSFVHGGDGSGVGSGVGKKMFSKRSCTEAMLKVLQHEIRKTHARSQNIE